MINILEFQGRNIFKVGKFEEVEVFGVSERVNECYRGGGGFGGLREPEEAGPDSQLCGTHHKSSQSEAKSSS